MGGTTGSMLVLIQVIRFTLAVSQLDASETTVLISMVNKELAI